jgi:cleavage and polyadenylation specificity factor subunit 3
LPLFEACDPSKIDLILITHFHLDHCAALPYFLSKYPFNGKVYMTTPTRTLYKHQMEDSLDKNRDKNDQN